MKIDIKGPIIPDSQQWIYDWLEMPATSPKKVNDLIAKASKGEALDIAINSGGGSVPAGSEIFTIIHDYEGETNGKILGIAASAAGVIAMGIKNLAISPTAQIMIHRASTYTEGNAGELQKTVDMLKGFDRSIANAYILKTGIGQTELLNMMAEETFLDATQAKELGFVDSIMFENEFQVVAADVNSGILPEKIINKIMEEFKDKVEKNIKQETSNKEIQNKLNIAKAKLQLQIMM